MTLSQLSRVLLETENSKIYPLVDRLLRIVLTLPVSTATIERAFSAMKLVKTQLRNKIEDTFLAYCLIVYIEKEIIKNVSTTTLIENFIDVTEQMAQLR